MKNKSIAMLIVGLAIISSATASGLPSKAVDLKAYVTVRQATTDAGHVVTINEIKTYEVGYEVTKEDGRCWKSTTIETGTKTVPVKLRAGAGETTFSENHPILATDKLPVECSAYGL